MEEPKEPQYQPAPQIKSLQKDGMAGPFFDAVEPAAFPKHIVRFRNDRWAKRIGLNHLSDHAWIQHFGAFQPLPDNLKEPLALRYHGHQFRHYNPDIGDGRGFLFAQLRDDQNRLLDLGTKGSGQTPYSRSGDGRLTLKGSVREILATEMLEALGVYTSKTFSVIETGESLHRDDEPSPTRSAVLVRLGHSHIRFGAFQRLAQEGNTNAIKKLIDYCVDAFDPDLTDHSESDKAIAFFDRVVSRTARLAAQWTMAGFVHGVLNTDNMNVTGESFDYGPWRFLPHVDFGFTAAYFDQTGLYAFGRQPEAAAWNLSRFGGTLSLIAPEERLNQSLGLFHDRFLRKLATALFRRLGCIDPEIDNHQSTAGAELANQILRWLSLSRIPFEQFFFDWFGGPMAEERAMARDEAYKQDNFKEIKQQICDLKPLELPSGAQDYLATDGPETILIDEVESIWASIATNDNWQPLEQKIRAIREMGQAYDIYAEWSVDG
ncbi:MAG: YdiU family protein [Pseudomonadota bacterium]